MAITQTLLSMDSYFQRVPGDKIIVNDLSMFDIDDKNLLDNNLITVYNNTDTFSSKPSCDCGGLQGGYLLGKVCKSCGTTCKEQSDKVYPYLWLRCLRPELKFMNPAYWIMMNNIIGKPKNSKTNRFDSLRWLSDPKYNPDMKIPPILYTILEITQERSYLKLIENIEPILHLIKSLDKSEYKCKTIDYMLEMWHTNRNAIFSNYLPIINKKLFVKEVTNKGTFVNMVAGDAVDVVMEWLKVSTVDTKKDSLTNDAIHTARMLSKMTELHINYQDKCIVSKGGMLRKNVYGSRGYFTFRNVITSIEGKHRYDEIIVPWVIGPTVFRPHILNKLIKRGYTYNDATYLINKSIKSYVDVIDEILQELIAEAPNKRIPVIIQRNPSLKRGSAVRVFITKFNNKDILDKTVHFSSLSVSN